MVRFLCRACTSYTNNTTVARHDDDDDALALLLAEFPEILSVVTKQAATQIFNLDGEKTGRHQIVPTAASYQSASDHRGMQ